LAPAVASIFGYYCYDERGRKVCVEVEGGKFENK